MLPPCHLLCKLESNAIATTKIRTYQQRSYKAPSWTTVVSIFALVCLLVSTQPCSAAPVDGSSLRSDLPAALSRHTRGSSDKGCQITSSEIALPLTFTIEMPSYVMIGNHKFNLKLQMPLVTRP